MKRKEKGEVGKCVNGNVNKIKLKRRNHHKKTCECNACKDYKLDVYHLNNKCECEVCYEKFSEEKLRDHHKQTHTTELVYKCKFCNMGFKQQDDFENHVNLHHSNGQHCCQHCVERFTSTELLKEHEKSHPKFLKSYRCGKPFSSTNNLVQYRKSYRYGINGENIYECPRKKAKKEDTMGLNVNREYKGYCFHCGEKFQTSQLHKLHMENLGLHSLHHKLHMEKQGKSNVSEKYKCTECSNTFYFSGCFNSHKKTHLSGSAECDEGSFIVTAADISNIDSYSCPTGKVFRPAEKTEVDTIPENGIGNVKSDIDHVHSYCISSINNFHIFF